jgi:hypothetical protein
LVELKRKKEGDLKPWRPRLKLGDRFYGCLGTSRAVGVEESYTGLEHRGEIMGKVGSSEIIGCSP